MTTSKYIYKLEFVIEDLFILKQNKLIPDEYKTAAKFSLGKLISTTIQDIDLNCFKNCENHNISGKCFVFSLGIENLKDKTSMTIRIFRQKTYNCKFLIGKGKMPIKNIFYDVMQEFKNNNTEYFEYIEAKREEEEKIKNIIKDDQKIEKEQKNDELKENESIEILKSDIKNEKQDSEESPLQDIEPDYNPKEEEENQSRTIKLDHNVEKSQIQASQVSIFSDSDSDDENYNSNLIETHKNNIIPTTITKNCMVLLHDADHKLVGNIVFVLKLTCFGPNITSEFKLHSKNKWNLEDPCEKIAEPCKNLPEKKIDPCDICGEQEYGNEEEKNNDEDLCLLLKKCCAQE